MHALTTDPGSEEEINIVRSVTMVLHSKAGIFLAKFAYDVGFLCSYFDATGKRVKAWESLTGEDEYLNTTWVSLFCVSRV